VGAKPATTFCIIKTNAVDSFLNTLNSIDQHISFTIEEENNNHIAFLDALITRKDNNSIPVMEELVCFLKWAAPSDFSNCALLSYITGISQPLTRLLRKHDIRVVSKSRPPIDLQANVVYKISRADCPWSYVGETGRCLESKKKKNMHI